MLLASICFRVLPHKRAEGLGAIDALAGHMRASAGCSRSRVLNDAEDINTVVLMSEWNEPEQADHFFNSREFHIFKGIRILLRDEPYIVLDDIRTRMTRMMKG